MKEVNVKSDDVSECSWSDSPSTGDETSSPGEILLWSIKAAIASEERFASLQPLNPTLTSSLKSIFPKQNKTTMRWYYEKKELRSAPSIQSGLELDTEARYRREGARFIIDIGSSMNLSLTTMATGVVYFHRFYMFHTFQDFARYPTALACLFLAGKVEETPKKCKDMLKVARDILDDPKWATFGQDIYQKCEEVMTLERIILQTIKFDLHVEHPYTFLLKYAKCLKGDKARLQKMVQMAWTFVNDSLCTTLCLQWEPEIVAIALMHLAGKLSKFEVSDWIGRTPNHLRWWDMFVEGMTIELLEDICHQVLDLYSQTQNQAQQNGSQSPPPPAIRSSAPAPPLPPPTTSGPPTPTPVGMPPLPVSYPAGSVPPLPHSFMSYPPPPAHVLPNYPPPPPSTGFNHPPPPHPQQPYFSQPPPLPPQVARAPLPPPHHQQQPPPPLPPIIKREN